MGVEDNTDISTTSHHKHIIYILLGQILNFIRATTSNRVDGHNKQGNPVFAKLADLTWTLKSESKETTVIGDLVQKFLFCPWFKDGTGPAEPARKMNKKLEASVWRRGQSIIVARISKASFWQTINING